MSTASRPLRVVYLVPDLGVGGAERHVTTLMPALDRDRFEPSVICIGAEGLLFGALAQASVPALALHRTRRQAIAAGRELVRELRRLCPDVVIMRGYNAEALGRIAARIAGVPRSIVWVHNYGDLEPRSALRIRADRVLDRYTDAYFGVARAQRDYLVGDLGYPAEKVVIVHNGVDPALFDPTDSRRAVREFGVAEGEPLVGILAALRPEKDHRLFLEAAVLVLAELPTAKFLVVGDGVARPALVRRARELGIAEHVVFTGSRSDTADLLRALDVFVLCSYSVECFPMALLEAMAAGRPAVCTAVGGVPEMVIDQETGFLVPPRDARTLADKVVAILRDPALRRRMGEAARHRVQTEFSLRASVLATEEALERVAAVPPDAARPPVVLTVVLDLTFVGGVETLLLELFRHLDPVVVRPRLVCLRAAGPLADDFRAAGFEVTVLTRTGRYGLNRLAGLVRDLRTSGTAVVLVAHHHRAALLLGRLAARWVGVPSVLAAHDMDLASVGRRVLPRWAVSTLRLSDALVLLTPAQGRYLHREEGVGRSPASTIREVLIPNGIVLPPPADPAERTRARAELGLGVEGGLGSGDFAIGIVARLSAQKAHQVLFAAMAELVRTHPRARLFVIGGGDREEELRALAGELGIAAVTSFLGVRRDVSRLLPGLDVSCLSSVHEGVPISVIEALAAGLPVVATNCGSLKDMITDGEQGYLVPVGDAHGLAQRLAFLADDPGLRKQLGASGRARAECAFSITTTARGYERLVTELANKRVSRRPRNHFTRCEAGSRRPWGESSPN